MDELNLHSGASTEFLDELIDLVFDGQFDSHHRDLRDIILDPIFDHHAGLNLVEAGHLSYERCRSVHRRIEEPLKVLSTPQRLFALAEWPALRDVSTFSLLMVHYNLCLGTIFDHGLSNNDIAEETQSLNKLTAFGPYMATELGFGNNVAALRTEARYDRERCCFILNTPDDTAQKYMSYSGFDDIPKIAVVLARLVVDGKDWGPLPFVVRLTENGRLRPGISAIPCPEKPVQGLDNGLTRFTEVELPMSSLLCGDMGEFSSDGSFIPKIGNARKRFLRTMSRIVPGRLCVASAAVGAGKASIYLTLKFAQNRLTNAPGNNDMPIIEYRTYQRDTFRSLAHVFAMVSLLNHAKRAYIEADDAEASDLNDLISITKALVTWEMTEVIANCRERCGAQGIFSANRIVDYGSLLQGLVTAEGDNQVLLATTAGQILMKHRTIFPPDPLDPVEKSMGDTDWLDALLDFREKQLLADASVKLRDVDGDSFFDTLNRIMPAGLEMIRARGVHTSFRAFCDRILGCRNPQLVENLTHLAHLFALDEIKRTAGWYVAKGALTAEQVLTIDDLFDDICVALRPHVDKLIDGFGLDAGTLGAPIGRVDYIEAFQRQADQEWRTAARARPIHTLVRRPGKHVYSCELRWGDMDIYGIVNNVIYLRLLEQARVDLIMHLASNDSDAFFADGSVVVDHRISYKARLVYRHQPVLIETSVSQLGRASVTLKSRIIDGSKVCAEAETTMAPFDYKSGFPRRLTDSEYNFFSTYLGSNS